MGCCHWFKGQDVTINGYSGQPLIKQDDDYYRDMLIKYYGDTKEPTEVMKKLIANGHNFTRYDRLKKLGYVSEVPLVKSNLNQESILGAVRDDIDVNASSIINYKEYPAIFIRVIRYLNDNYTNDTDHTKTFKVDIGIDANTIVTDSITSPEYTINDKKYLIKSNDTNSDYIYLVDNTHVRLSELDKDGNETSTTIDIEFDISIYAKRIAVSYVSGYGDTASNVTGCIDSNDIPQDWYQYRGLIIPIKNNGNLIKNDKTLYPALRSLGVALKDMQDSLSGSEIADAFITYMAKDGGIFKNEIEQLYNHFIDLQIDDGNCSMYYHNITKEDNDGIINTENRVTINGTLVGDSYMDYFMNHKICPIQKLDELNIRDKYKAIQEVLSIITHSQETKHLKWYQTSDFIFGLKIAGAVVAALAGPEAFMIYGGTLAITEMILPYVNSPWVRAAIIIVLVIAGNWSTVSNYSTASVTALSNVGLQVTTALVNAREEEILNQMEKKNGDISDQTKEVEEQLNKLKKQAIYHPFLSMDLMFEGPYTLPYTNYETIDSACTISYDTIY